MRIQVSLPRISPELEGRPSACPGYACEGSQGWGTPAKKLTLAMKTWRLEPTSARGVAIPSFGDGCVLL